jgi:putative hydrolase of HD superfamily
MSEGQVSIEQFGQDHWSTFAFIACNVVSADGEIDRRKMRCHADRHPLFYHLPPGFGGGKSPTRLRGGVTLADHDDWDCAEDLTVAGLLVWGGSGANPVFSLTDRGWVVLRALLKHKQGIPGQRAFGTFCWPPERHENQHAEKVPDFLELARLALRFGQVRRVTLHPDGERESDTTHTVMLIWIACALAGRAGLNVGLVAQLAAVHDMPEALVGDVQTLRISDEDRARKEEREDEAAEAIATRFLDGPAEWVGETLGIYRAQAVPEARFVRAVDKMLPKLTHLLNGGAAIHAIGVERGQFEESMARQTAELEAYAGEFREALDLRLAMVPMVADLLPDLQEGAA